MYTYTSVKKKKVSNSLGSITLQAKFLTLYKFKVFSIIQGHKNQEKHVSYFDTSNI